MKAVRRRLLALAALALVGAGGCTSFGESRPASDAGDAPMEAGSDAGGGCAAKLCVTFDPPLDGPPYAFDAITAGAGDVTLAMPGLRSANALRVRSPKDPVFLSRDIGLVQRISMRLNLWVDALPPAKNPSRPFEVVCSQGGAFHVLRVFDDGALDFTDGSGHPTDVTKITAMTWNAVQITVTLDATSSTSTVTTASDGKSATATAAGCNGTVSLHVGDMRDAPSSAVLLFDDIQADWM